MKRRVSIQDNGRKPIGARRYVHGFFVNGDKHPLHAVYAGMLARCYNRKHLKFPAYGGRGIKVCNRWKQFKNFVKDVGTRPTARHQLGRKNNNRGYCPDNCEWQTPIQNARNTRQNRILELNGRKATLGTWSQITGIHYRTIGRRIDKLGWSVKDALTTSTEIYKNRAKVKK